MKKSNYRILAFVAPILLTGLIIGCRADHEEEPVSLTSIKTLSEAKAYLDRIDREHAIKHDKWYRAMKADKSNLTPWDQRDTIMEAIRKQDPETYEYWLLAAWEFEDTVLSKEIENNCLSFQPLRDWKARFYGPDSLAKNWLKEKKPWRAGFKGFEDKEYDRRVTDIKMVVRRLYQEHACK